MENYDPALAIRVWERVRQRQDEADLSPALMPLISEAAADAAVCRRLASAVSTRKAGLLRHVAENKQGVSDCLKGILRLLDDSSATTAAVVKSTGEAALRRCVGHSLRSAEALRQWRGHGEYGPVFAELAQTETENARLLLQVLGGQQP